MFKLILFQQTWNHGNPLEQNNFNYDGTIFFYKFTLSDSWGIVVTYVLVRRNGVMSEEDSWSLPLPKSQCVLQATHPEFIRKSEESVTVYLASRPMSSVSRDVKKRRDEILFPNFLGIVKTSIEYSTWNFRVFKRGMNKL